jgi:superfamily II DNA helicase RecQ
VVFNDATLRELADVRPSSAAELAGITGIGPAKLERYGDDVLAVVAGG